MKKLISSVVFLSVAALAFISCKKDDDDEVITDIVIQTITPAHWLTQIDSLTISDTYVDDPYYEFGLYMTFKTSGTITALGVKMPDQQTYDVTLWNLKDTSIVRTTTISAESDISKFKKINPVFVKKGDKYAVTVYSNDYYYYEYPESQDIYPVDLGYLTIDGYSFINLPSKAFDETDFPVNSETDYYAGIGDIQFETAF